MALTAEQVASILYGVGFRGEDLVRMTAIAKRESGYNPAAHRSDQPLSKLSGDMGLFQINYSNWDLVSRELGLTNKAQLFDPVVNARAAKVLFDRSGYSGWTMGSNGWQAGGDPMKGTNVQAARQAVQNAQAQGLFGPAGVAGAGIIGGVVAGITPTGSSGTGAGAGTGSSGAGGFGATSVDAAPVTPGPLPTDIQTYRVPGTYMAFAVYEGPSGVRLAWQLTGNSNVQWDPNTSIQVTEEQWQAMRTVDAGDAAELVSTARTFGTFGRQWESTLNQVMGLHNPARNDPGVQTVLAQFASRPDMTPEELDNLLKGTDWYRSRTTSELEWNSLAPAEQQKRRDEIAANMADTWFTFGGVRVDPSDPRITNYLEDVASGKLGFGAWTERVVKAQAGQDPSSPFSRQTADEAKQRLQSGVDIENTAQRIKDLAKRWGIQWSEGAYQDWAGKVTRNEASEADVLASLQQQAQVLYPWKDPTMETVQAATPWTETYSRVMEKQTDLFNPQVQAALTAGRPVWEFEQGLKKTSGWLETKNAKEEMYGVVAEAGRRMGFS